jgi:hypothetical protein
VSVRSTRSARFVGTSIVNQTAWFVNLITWTDVENFTCRTRPFGVMFRLMKKSTLSKHLSQLGKKGGKARMESLTADQRRELASRAGKKSGQARRKKGVKHGS